MHHSGSTNHDTVTAHNGTPQTPHDHTPTTTAFTQGTTPNSPSPSPSPTLTTHHEQLERPTPTLSFAPDPRPWSTRSWSYQNRPFRGIVSDISRRLPFYWTDWTHDVWNNRVLAATVRMYFLNLMPAIAYTLDMRDRTGGAYGLNESLLASAIAAIGFAVFAVQPLTIVGITGLISLFNFTVYDIIAAKVDYLQFQAWVLIWSAIMHFIVAIFNLCDYTRFITDMTSETFGIYVGTIYIQKGIELLVVDFTSDAAGWFSVVVAILFALFAYFLERTGTLPFGTLWMRNLFTDYSFAAATILFTGFVHIPGHITSAGIAFLPITEPFEPSTNRAWIIEFWKLPVGYIFIAIPFGALLTLLFYFDNNVSSLNAQSRGFPVKRPAGFHWDFALLGITTLISGILGLPAPNGLVPQAPVHTESLCELKLVSPEGEEEGEDDDEKRVRKPMVLVRTRVVEQRVSHFVMGLGVLGTMSGPLLVVLGIMPRALFAGVFLVVGWGSIESNPIIHKTLFLLRDSHLIPLDHPLVGLKKLSIAKFLAIQWAFYAAIIAISETIAAIGFPIIIMILIPVRHFLVPLFLTPHELSILDAPTANSEAVLVSIGGPLESASEEDGLEEETTRESGEKEVRGFRRRKGRGVEGV